MSEHLNAVSLAEHQRVLDAAREYADRAERAEAALARVRALHGRHDPNCPYGEDCAGAGLCLACREEYPCATIRALDGDSEDALVTNTILAMMRPDDDTCGGRVLGTPRGFCAGVEVARPSSRRARFPPHDKRQGGRRVSNLTEGGDS